MTISSQICDLIRAAYRLAVTGTFSCSSEGQAEEESGPSNCTGKGAVVRRLPCASAKAAESASGVHRCS